MRQMSGSLMNSRISINTSQDEIGQGKFLGSPIQISGGDRMKIKDDI